MFALRPYFHLPMSIHGGDIRTLIGTFGLRTSHQTSWNFHRAVQESDSTCVIHLSLPSSLTGVRPAYSQWALFGYSWSPAPLFFTDVYCPIPFWGLHCRAPELTHQVNKSLPRRRTENESKVNYWSLLWTSFLRTFVADRHLEVSWKKNLLNCLMNKVFTSNLEKIFDSYTSILFKEKKPDFLSS